MSDQWSKARVGDICEVFDGPHATPARTSEGPIFLGISSLNSGRIDLEQSDHISEEDFIQWTRRVTPEGGDIVFSYETRLGEAGIIPKGLRCCLGRRMGLLRVKDRSVVDPRFLLYNYLGPHFQSLISERTVFGSTVERIPLKEVPDFLMALPSISEQKAIAHILGTLDDKIELNRKTNETLEAMAKALFKSWFVDFDPVRAKAEGRPTGLPAEISDLFPNSFETSDLGDIPSGWEIALLGDQIDLVKGRSYKSDELNPSTTALVTLKSFHRNGGYRPDGLKGFTGEYKEHQRVKPGELVIALTDVTQAADVIGRPAIVKSDAHYSTLVASLDVGIVRPNTTGFFSTPYLYFLMLTPRYVQHILGYTSGTTVLHLAKDGVPNFSLALGSSAILSHFTQLADLILRQIDASSRQSELLTKTRDTLLPKLISGEIRIPDAERMLEEVGL